MNIQALLHHELTLVARSIVARKYNEPTFSVKEQLAFARADKERRDRENEKLWPQTRINPFMNRVTRRKEFKRDLSQSSAKEQALQMYISVATLMEYNDLLITVDNACSLIFEEWKFKGSASSFKVKKFFKYYAPLSKACEKDQRKDCARYAYLRMIDEEDQTATFGLSWRPDASYVDKHGKIKDKFGRTVSVRSRVNQYINSQHDRPHYEEYEVVDGVVKSSYEILMGSE